MSKSRKKLESQVVPESHDLCSPKFSPVDPAPVPYEEWSDSDINLEKWETLKDNKETLYRDPQVAHLPPSLQGVQWKRPCEVFPNSNFTIFIGNPAYPDLVGGSKHLLASEFVQRFVHSVATLCLLGNAGKFPAEYTCLNFAPATEKQPWRPWHHIYSKCRAGKGQNHNPTVNKCGKYIIRLFWLGSWRKIYVDDLLPVNADDEVLLPSLPIPKDTFEPSQIKEAPSEKISKISKSKTGMSSSKSAMGNRRVIELWPFLLAKALMKLANLTWGDGEDLVDFDMIHCLSGLDTEEIWAKCMSYTTQYKWQEPTDRSTTKLKQQAKTKSKLSLGKTKSAVLRSKNDDENYTLVLCLRHQDCSIAGCDTHCLLVEQTRDVDLVKPSKEEDFPPWKRYRWLDWAIENNILPPKESTTPIKCLKLVDPFRQLCNSIYGDDYGSKEKEDEVYNVFIKKQNTKELGDEAESSKRLELISFTNLTKWLDFDQVVDNIFDLVVYFKPSKFPVKIRISDMSSRTITKELRYPLLKTLEDSMVLEWKEIIKPSQASLFHKNEPVYMLSDSLCSRTLIINLAQVGSQQDLQDDPESSSKEEIVEPSDSECGICLSTILERLKRKTEKELKGEKNDIIQVLPNEYHYRPVGHMVLCKFKWYSNHTDDVADSIRTYGTSTMVLNLKPGRHSFRLLIKTDTPYVTQILSDAPLCVGYLEEIYPLMSEETCLVTELSETVTKSFQDLAKSFGKEDFPVKLRNFYDSYKPCSKEDKEELLTIHQTFYKTLFKLISDNLGEPELAAIKVLLKQWQFPSRKCHAEDTSGFCFEPGSEQMEYVKIIQKATVVLQAFFRGVYERLMMKRHSPTNKHYKATVECLQHIHALLTSKGTSLLRLLYFDPGMIYITERLEISEDLENAITLYQFSNSTRLSDQGWNFICRQTFYVSSAKPIIVRISMFCDLERYSVRVFDNDSTKEKKVYTNDVLTDEYRVNANGYTVLCYGTSLQAKHLYYKLCYATQKEATEKLLHFPHNQTKNEVLSGNYVPSRRNRICRYKILVQSEHVMATLQFSTNYPDVKINMKLFKDEELLLEVSGTGSVLVPSLMLGSTQTDTCKKEYKDESLKSMDKKSTTKGLHKPKNRSHSSSMDEREKDKLFQITKVYYMEANVVDDSWPLTAAEWKVVESLRAKKLRGGLNGNMTKSSSTRKQTLTSEFQSPSWTLQIISGTSDLVTFSKDEKKDMELRQIKLRWYANDPMRYKKSEELRNAFIDENKVNNEDRCLNSETRSLNPEIFEEEILPPYDTYCNMYKDINAGADAEKRVLKDTVKIHEDIENEFRDIVRFREYIEDATEKIEDMATQQVENYNLMKDWYNGCRIESQKMMEDAQRMKQKYIDKFIESTVEVKEKEKKATKKPKK